MLGSLGVWLIAYVPKNFSFRKVFCFPGFASEVNFCTILCFREEI